MVAHSEENKGPLGEGKEMVMGDRKKRIKSAVVQAPHNEDNDTPPRAGI